MSKTKQMFSDSELVRCEPVGRRIESAGKELGRFRELWKELGGLITATQAAFLLGVSRERVRQLGAHGQVRRCEALGRVYYSSADVDKRVVAQLDEQAAQRGSAGSELRRLWRSSIADGRNEIREA